MKKLLLIALLGTVLLSALPGGAQSTTTPPALTYAGRGLTSGLSLTIMGQGLQTGVTETNVANAATDDCAGIACATAAGAAPPFGENAEAVSPGNPGPNAVQIFDIGDDASEELEQLLTGTIGAASAQTTDQPLATGIADGLSSDLTISQTIVGQLPPEVTEPLEDGLGQIGEALAPIAEADPTGVIGGVTDTLEGLVGDLTSSPLARIQAGQSTSTTDFETGTVSATAAAAGAVIVILPTPASTVLLPEGLAVIEVGPSNATATANGTNMATADANASIARITLLPGVLDGLPGLDPDSLEELPLEDILDLLPPEVTDLLPVDLDDLLGGDEDPDDPADDPVDDDEGPTGTPIDDLIPGFMQADENSGGFVIDLETGTEQTCILEDTPLETCITLGGTSETFSEDGLGVGVLAAGVDISALRGAGEFMTADSGVRTHAKDGTQFAQVATGPGLLELNIGRSEAGVAAAFVQAVPPPASPSPSASPTTPPRALPQTGGSSLVLPSLALMALSGVALVSLRRRRDV